MIGATPQTSSKEMKKMKRSNSNAQDPTVAEAPKEQDVHKEDDCEEKARKDEEKVTFNKNRVDYSEKGMNSLKSEIESVASRDAEIDHAKKTEQSKENKKVNFMETETEGIKLMLSEEGRIPKEVTGEELDQISQELVHLVEAFQAAKMRIVANEKDHVERMSKLTRLLSEYRQKNEDDLRTKDIEVTTLQNEITKISDARMKTESACAVDMDQLKAKFEELKRESDVSKNKLVEKEKAFAEIADQMMAAKESERNLTAQLEQERDAKGTVKSKVDLANQHLQERELDLANLRLELAAVREELRMTKVKDVERWKAKVDHLNKVIGKLDVAKRELEEKDRTIKLFKDELKVVTDSYKSVEDGMKKMSEKVKTLEMERETVEVQLKEKIEQVKEMRHSEEKQKAKEEGLVKVIGIAEGMVKDKDKQIRSINEELTVSRQKEHALNERLGEVDQMVYVLTKADNKHKEVEEQLMAELSSVKKKLEEEKATQVGFNLCRENITE